MAVFEDLDDDVLYLILDHLYLERFTVLRQLQLTSTRLRDFVDAAAHRNVSLIDDEVHEKITYRLIERLTNPSDKICRYVRQLHIVGFRGNEISFCLNNGLIRECIANLERLDSFSWDCDAPLSIDLLSVLQHRFPRAQLCINTRNLDQPHLFASQLHRLEVSVPCADLSGQDSVSMFRRLTRALLQVPTLRHLRIDTHLDVDIYRNEGASLDTLQLALTSDDRLPALESLEFLSTSYVLTEHHCLHLLANIDCGKLQRLILGSPNPINFFDVFHGRLPHLKHLEVSFAVTGNCKRDLQLGSATNFVIDLRALRSLVVCFDVVDLQMDFFKLMAYKIGPNLHHLSLRARQEDLGGPWYVGGLHDYLSYWFNNLRSLDLAFSDLAENYACPDCELYQWCSSKHCSLIPNLPNLHNIHISFRAPPSERSLLHHVSKHAHCSIRSLWFNFISDADTNLETFSIRFWRWESGRETHLKELIYDSTRLDGKVIVGIRNNHNIPPVVYKEVKDERWGTTTLTTSETQPWFQRAATHEFNRRR